MNFLVSEEGFNFRILLNKVENLECNESLLILEVSVIVCL